MARCKAIGFISTTTTAPPSPYLRCQIDQSNAVNNSSSKLNGCNYYPHCVGCAAAVIIGIYVAIAIFPYPLLASCTVRWNFDEPCKFVMQRLRSQILKWTPCERCGYHGSRCLYLLKDSTFRENNTIKATHLIPFLRSVDDIAMEFDEAQNGGCVATAKSASRSWFTVFDHGRNYCNLRNLVEDAGFCTDRGFGEVTNNKACTQHSTAVCA